MTVLIECGRRDPALPRAPARCGGTACPVEHPAPAKALIGWFLFVAAVFVGGAPPAPGCSATPRPARASPARPTSHRAGRLPGHPTERILDPGRRAGAWTAAATAVGDRAAHPADRLPQVAQVGDAGPLARTAARRCSPWCSTSTAPPATRRTTSPTTRCPRAGASPPPSPRRTRTSPSTRSATPRSTRPSATQVARTSRGPRSSACRSRWASCC